MFSLLWRFVPGPAWFRLVMMLVVLAAAVYALVFYGYPWAAEFFEEDDIVTVSETQ
jgi:hypothetical protein